MPAESLLRLALIVPAGPWPRWLEQLVASLGPRVVAVRNVPAREPSRGLFGLYRALDDRVFTRADDAFALEPATPSATLTATPLPPDLDAVLWLADGPAPAHLPARLGLWKWEFAAGEVPLETAFARRLICVTANLHVRTAPGETLRSLGVCGLDLSSLRRTRVALAWRLSVLVLRCVQGFERGGWPTLDAMAPAEPLPAADGQPPTPAAELGRFGLELARRIAGNKLRHKTTNVQWQLGIRARDPARPVWQDASGFRALTPPRDRLWADPCLLRRDGVSHLFFEEQRFGEKGVIAWAPLAADGSMGPREVVLEAPCHVSYPFVFEHDGHTWLVPESCATDEIVLYRAAPFPTRWRREAVLLRGLHAVDSTLLHHDGRWWLFTNVAHPHGSTWDELSLYYADTLLGPWQPHPANPIVSDVRCARPAGRIFRVGDTWIRPAQDCAACYGAAVAFRAIEVLTPDRYRERPIGRLEPTWQPGLSGAHTYAVDDAFEVIDGLRRPLRWPRR